MLRAILIAGVNGVGKTTFAQRLIPRAHPDATYLNPDEIRAEAPSLIHPIASGRELLRRLAEKERLLESFAIETTLSSTMYARKIRSWAAQGYRVSLHFLEAPSESFAVGRVAKRVAEGGHAVPEADIHRRYHRGLVLFEHVYKALVHEWYHWKVHEDGARLVAFEKK